MKKAIIVILLLTFIGKDLQAQNTIPSHQDSVLGTWVWKRTECCNMGGGSHKKANPTLREKVIMMQKDSIFNMYNNDELTYTGKYKVIGFAFMKDPIRYTFFSEKMLGIIHYKNDTLVIGNCGTDGCDEYFVMDKPINKKAVKTKKSKNARHK